MGKNRGGRNGAFAPMSQAQSPGLGFERVVSQSGATYKDCSTVIVCPTRGMIHHRIVAGLMGMIAPMNQKRCFVFRAGDEVGRAYDSFVAEVLAHPELSKWKYLMSVEDDNLQPPDAHIRLLESIEAGPFDGVSGIYFTKGDMNMPMAYGDPEHFRRTGELEFRPRDIRQALSVGHVMEVNGIAMGCSLYRMDLFRAIPQPWFVTCADWIDGQGTKCFTQDLQFCEKGRRIGKRFAVDMRVKVGHMNVSTGEIF